MITSYRKSEAPAGKPGQATGRAAGAGATPRSGAILPRIAQIVKPESPGAVHIVLRPGEPVDVQIHAVFEEDVRRLLPLAAAARARLALLEAP